MDPDGRAVAPVQVKLRAADYDAIGRLAVARRESVQDTIRRLVRREVSGNSGNIK